MKFYWKIEEKVFEGDDAIVKFCEFFNDVHDFGVKGNVGNKEVRIFLKKDLLGKLDEFQKAIAEKNVPRLKEWFDSTWLIVSPRSLVLLMVPKVKENRGIFLFSEGGIFYPTPLYQKVDEETNSSFSVLYFRVGSVFMELLHSGKVIFWYYKGGASLEQRSFKKEEVDEKILQNT